MEGGAAARGRRRDVVCIDPDADNLELIRQVLEETGLYRVFGVRDGAAGMQEVREREPDVVIAEVDLPVVSGLDLVRRIKADAGLRRTPVIACTAGVMRGERQRCARAGCRAFVEKPFDIHGFRKVVARACGIEVSDSAELDTLEDWPPPAGRP